MKRVLISLLLFALILTFSSSGLQLRAAQETPTPGAAQPANWALSTLLRLKPGIPFAWLRNAASSTGAVLDTALPSDFLVVVGTVNNQGSEPWWPVRRVNGNVTGYVEEKSLQLAVSPA